MKVLAVLDTSRTKFGTLPP